MQTIADKWMKEGEIIGERRGEKKGEKKGELKAEKKFKEEKRDMARRMLLKNFPLEEVINITNLTEKDIESLMN